MRSESSSFIDESCREVLCLLNSSSRLAFCRFFVTRLYLLRARVRLAQVEEVRLVLVEVQDAEEAGEVELLPYQLEESEGDVDEDDGSFERERTDIPLQRQVDQQQAEVYYRYHDECEHFWELLSRRLQTPSRFRSILCRCDRPRRSTRGTGGRC